ncbi:MAG: hypothetical protein NUV98_02575 [Candidatus Roizmanbacteria bacterium]|nr:hypothetical protein [Candidatus Roizmanbacteria bacterium]
MIVILHGDHQVASRNRLLELKSQAKESEKEIITLDGAILELTDLIQSLESTSLFNEQKLVVSENLLSNLRIGKKRDEIINYLVTAPWVIPDTDRGSKRMDSRLRGNDQVTLILWEKGSVGRQIIKLKKQKHVTVEEFKMPTVIFTFVDNLKPRNAATLLDSFHNTLDNKVVPEIVFTMIIRQFRLMLALQTNAELSETKRIAPWQRGKLSKQSQEFSLDQLKKHYKELLVIDFQTKTGKSPLNLTQRIEQFIIGL